MSDRDALMGELRAHFRETTQVRLREMYVLLETIEHADAVDKLLRHFHALAGLGATYGYPRISELGDEGEGLTVRDAQRWRELVDEVARQLC